MINEQREHPTQEEPGRTSRPVHPFTTLGAMLCIAQQGPSEQRFVQSKASDICRPLLQYSNAVTLEKKNRFVGCRSAILPVLWNRSHAVAQSHCPVFAKQCSRLPFVREEKESDRINRIVLRNVFQPERRRPRNNRNTRKLVTRVTNRGGRQDGCVKYRHQLAASWKSRQHRRSFTGKRLESSTLLRQTRKTEHLSCPGG